MYWSSETKTLFVHFIVDYFEILVVSEFSCYFVRRDLCFLHFSRLSSKFIDNITPAWWCVMHARILLLSFVSRGNIGSGICAELTPSGGSGGRFGHFFSSILVV